MDIIVIFLKLIILVNTSTGFNLLQKIKINRKQIKLIEDSMDPTTDPCENFYQYACGNWDKVHKDISKYEDHFQMIDYNTNKEMAKLLAANERTMKRTIITTEEPKFLTTVRSYYKSCVGLKFVQPIEYLKWLENTEHINMMLTKSNTKSRNTSIDFDWLKYLAVMNKYGLKGVFLEETYVKSHQVLVIDRPLREGGYKKLHLDLFNYVTSGKFIENADAETFSIKWKDVSTFENDLMKLHIFANGTSTLFDMDTLSDVPWLHRYVNMLLQNTQFPFPVTGWTILVKDIAYLTQLYDLVQQYDQQFLCEYLKIRFLWDLIVESYPSNNTPESCAVKARKYMYLATDYLFERQHVDLVQSIPKIQSMFSNIKDHFSKILLANPNGFNSTVMNFLLGKLNSTQLVVGLLPRNNTEQVLETLYSSIQLNESRSESFYGNQMQLLKFKTNSEHPMWTYTWEDPSTYFEHTKQVTPYHIRPWNTIFLPITTLQPPMYDANLEGFFTYSSLGYILGHELTHGFDSTGILFDPNDINSETSIYHEMINDNQRYQQNLACLSRLNSGDVDEKIADVTGFRVAFQTYFELNPKTGVTYMYDLNGIRLSVEKLFILNFAHYSCSTSKESSFEDKAHGTDEERTIDTLAHSPEFVKTFECPTYTDMHVQKRCQLWRK